MLVEKMILFIETIKYRNVFYNNKPSRYNLSRAFYTTRLIKRSSSIYRLYNYDRKLFIQKALSPVVHV